jgi:2-keto-3-deoxy-6-phosphogluconate aldolase
MMALGEKGFSVLKFFPATAAGGLNFLKALISPLPQFQFCPTGGITLATAPDWLALGNIPCLGWQLGCPTKAYCRAKFQGHCGECTRRFANRPIISGPEVSDAEISDAES